MACIKCRDKEGRLRPFSYRFVNSCTCADKGIGRVMPKYEGNVQFTGTESRRFSGSTPNMVEKERCPAEHHCRDLVDFEYMDVDVPLRVSPSAEPVLEDNDSFSGGGGDSGGGGADSGFSSDD